jgi:hypothetical protein
LDTLVGTVCSGSACRQAADNTHFTGNGSDSAATLWESVIAARTWPQVFRAALFTSSTIVQIAAAHRLAVRWIGRIAVKPERLERDRR